MLVFEDGRTIGTIGGGEIERQAMAALASLAKIEHLNKVMSI
jgi:xanthine/CO dehydrogenase XdhC/CoxF family maturation factor